MTTVARSDCERSKFTAMVGILGLLLAATPVTPSVAVEPDQTKSAADALVDRIERRIAKEPKYKSALPKYALIALGANANSKVWIVEDGKSLYIDKNANGDLTDDGPPVEPTHVRDLGAFESAASRWDFDYLLEEITPSNGSRHTDFCLRRWNYGGKEDSYGLSMNVDGLMPMYAGWFGTFWAESPAVVPIIHFGGALEPRMLRRKEFVIGAGLDRLSVAFINRDGGEGATARLSIDALPKALIPNLRIEWPVAGSDSPLQISYPLKDRCCYWEFYEPNFKMPTGVVVGEATVTVSIDGGDFPFELRTNQVKVPVVASPSERSAK
ncbi:MAG TPA: hypothetical protein VGG64_10825 [Pirellulales bacterium]